MTTIKEEWYIIVNPHAGSGKTMKYWVPAERLLKEYNIPFMIKEGDKIDGNLVISVESSRDVFGNFHFCIAKVE